MPYSSVSQLPEYVKAQLKTRKKQRQWMHVWNSVHQEMKDEGRAFAAANSKLGITRTKGEEVEMVAKSFYEVKDNELKWFIPFEKMDEEQRIVGGWATTEQMDKSYEIVDYEASKHAFGEWIGNVREQHDPRKAIGKAVKVDFDDDKKAVWVETYISKSSDGQETWTKVKEGILKGYSISGRIFDRVPEIVKVDNKTISANRVKKYNLTELSLVDSPMNKETLVEMIKSVDGKIEVSKSIENIVSCPCFTCHLEDQADKSDNEAHVYLVLRKAAQEYETQKELAASDGDLVIFPDGNYVTCVNPHKFMYTFQPALDDISKAKWTRKFINDLPDAAFAYIESGGKKDEDGKTVPRSLRHFPHHTNSIKSGDDSESIDLPHLHNALARIGQGSEFAEKAKAHLVKHAKSLKIGEFSEKVDNSMNKTEHIYTEEYKKRMKENAQFTAVDVLSRVLYDILYTNNGDNKNDAISTVLDEFETAIMPLVEAKKYEVIVGKPLESDVQPMAKVDVSKPDVQPMAKIDLSDQASEISKVVIEAINKEFSMEKFSTTVKDSVQGQVQRALDEKFGEVSGVLGQMNERLSKIESSPAPDMIFTRPIDKEIGAQGSNMAKSVDDMRIEHLEELMKKTTNDGIKALLGKELAQLIHKKERLGYQIGGRLM